MTDLGERMRDLVLNKSPRAFKEARGFAADLLHPPNGYLQPIYTLMLALAVMGVGGSIARDAQNSEMCARRRAYMFRTLAHLRVAQERKIAAHIGVSDKEYGAVRDFCSWYE